MEAIESNEDRWFCGQVGNARGRELEVRAGQIRKTEVFGIETTNGGDAAKISMALERDLAGDIEMALR